MVKHLKAKDGVFSALRSTLSQPVLTNKMALHIVSRSLDSNKAANESCSDSSSSDEENHAPADKETAAASRSFSDSLHGTQEDRQMGGGDECPLILPPPPKPSPGMAVNGS